MIHNIKFIDIFIYPKGEQLQTPHQTSTSSQNMLRRDIFLHLFLRKPRAAPDCWKLV